MLELCGLTMSINFQGRSLYRKFTVVVRSYPECKVDCKFFILEATPYSIMQFKQQHRRDGATLQEALEFTVGHGRLECGHEPGHETELELPEYLVVNTLNMNHQKDLLIGEVEGRQAVLIGEVSHQ